MDQTSYGSNQLESNPRQTEGRALAEVARRLHAAQQSGDEEKILEAIRLNMRLWTIFQAELLHPDCDVPIDVRQNVLSLAAFVDRRTADLLFKPEETEKIDVLVNINRQLASGLLSTPEDQPEQAAEPDTQHQDIPEDEEPFSFDEEI